MRKVFKYSLDTRVRDVLMPVGAEVISAEAIDGSIYMWAVVDPDARVEPRRFYVLATGEVLPDAQLKHVGTVVTVSGYVYHVFEHVVSSRSASHINMSSGVVGGSLIQAHNVDGGIRM